MATPSTDMATPSTERPDGVRDELSRIIVAAASELLGHPYYRGLRDGSLPAVALAHLCCQDAYHLLPAYGRAHARCAGMARRNDHARLLANMSLVSLRSAAGSAEGLARLAQQFGLPEPEGPPEIAPATLDYVHFLTAASATSWVTGLGAVVPSAWLYQLVTDGLIDRSRSGGRYEEVIATMHPGPEYPAMVDGLLGVVEQFCMTASEEDRAVLVRHTELGARLEQAFVAAAWRISAPTA
jgi:thiaminase (transcriptional activator TenA)